jgi:TPR repeat protein
MLNDGAADAGDLDAAFNLGVLLEEAGRVEEAEQMCRRAADAGDMQAAFNLGVLLEEAGRGEEAEQMYRRAADAGHTGKA